jgi:hypothetical protein
MTHLQTFFMVSGVIFWGLVVAIILGILAYLIVKDIPEPKGRTVDLTGITYDSNGSIKEQGKELRRLTYTGRRRNG